jgi:hypothetical protein
MVKKQKAPLTTVAFPEIIEKHIRQMAAEENRSLANMIRVLVQEAIEARRKMGRK